MKLPVRCCTTIVLVLAACMLTLPGRAQNVRQGSLSGYGLELSRFAKRAREQGRSDWFARPFDRPGTDVQITFDPGNADVTLVTRREFGTARLLQLCRRLAAALTFHDADYILREGAHTVSVDIELNKYMRHGRFTADHTLDLSMLAGLLRTLPLQQPVVIGIDSSEATEATITRRGQTQALDRFWFASPAEIAPGSTLTFHAEVTAGSFLFLGFLGLALLSPLVITARARRASADQAPDVLHPAVVQRKYDRERPLRIVFTLLLLAIPLLVYMRPRTAHSPMIALMLLAPGHVTAVMFAAPALVLVMSLVLRPYMRRLNRSDQTARQPAQLDAEAALRRMRPLFLLALIPLLMLGLMLYLPVYNQQGLLLRRNIVFALIGLTALCVPVVIVRSHRGMRRTLTAGPRFDMVHSLADHAGVHVRSVFEVTSAVPNAFATPFGSIGITTGLTERMDPDEVRAVVAHEIGHLQLRHPQKTVAVSLGWLVVIVAVWALFHQYAASTGTHGPSAGLQPLIFLLGTNLFTALLMGPGRRKREREADACAVALTGDPELVIRALTRMHDISGQAHRLEVEDEVLRAHPSLMHRVEAIRQRG